MTAIGHRNHEGTTYLSLVHHVQCSALTEALQSPGFLPFSIVFILLYAFLRYAALYRAVRATLRFLMLFRATPRFCESLRHTALLRYAALHCASLRFSALLYASLRYAALLYTPLRYTALRQADLLYSITPLYSIL